MTKSSIAYKLRKNHVFIYFFLILGSFIMIFPFIWMILTSFKTISESMQVPPTFLPESYRFDNYKDVLQLLPFKNLYINTGLLILLRIICAVAFHLLRHLLLQSNFRLKSTLYCCTSTDDDTCADFHNTPV